MRLEPVRGGLSPSASAGRVLTFSRVTATSREATRGAHASRPDRLAFLDGLRGVAVALVLVQHVGELVSPAVRHLTSSTVQLGQLGVMVFFLCSGFIIPASLEGSGGATSRLHRLGVFWRRRLLRLYPLYWCSVTAALALTLVGAYAPSAPVDAGEWLLNGSMVHGWFGVPHAMDLYWTLSLEMAFYAACSVLLVLGWHRASVTLSLTASATSTVIAVLAPTLLGRPVPLAVFCLVTMFTGTVFHRWHTGAVRLRSLSCCVTASLTAGTVVLASSLPGGDPGRPTVLAMLTAWWGAYAVFVSAVVLRHRAVPAWLRHLGLTSYSVYLVQAVVLAAIPAQSGPLLSVVVWLVATLAISEVTHRVVERPAIEWGRRLDRRSSGGPRRVRLAAELSRPAGDASLVRATS